MNKLVLITGAARRVGKYLSQYFAEKGYNVLIHVNTSVDEGEVLASELSAKYPKQEFNVIQFDLSQWKEAEDFIRKVYNQFGLPDVIIHNASHYLSNKLEETTVANMENMMAIHLFTPMVFDREFRKQNGKGAVISILDAAIYTNRSTHAMYLLAKKSLADYTKMAALEWAPHVRVNGIALGPVLPVEGKGEDVFNKVVATTPLKSQVQLTSISATINYVLTNKNMTGQIINCDSGQHLV